MRAAVADILIGAIGEVVADEAPRFIAEGMRRAAADTPDRLSATVLVVLAGFVLTYESVDPMAMDVQALLDGDVGALSRLVSSGAPDLDMLRLIEDWRHSTAEERARASRLAADVGAVVRDRVGLVSRAAVAAMSR